MDDEQRVDLGVSLLIPYRYTEDRVFRALQDAGFDDWTSPMPAVPAHRPGRLAPH